MMDIGTVVKEFGFQVGLVIFFVWWSWIREKRLTERLDKVQDYCIGEMSTVIRENSEAMRSLKTALEDRPCMARHSK